MSRLLSRPALMAVGATLIFLGAISAHAESVAPYWAPALAVKTGMPAAPAGTQEIKFGEFFRTPVGPEGLEPSAKLLQLHGKRVRLVGYMVRDESPLAGRFILSPLPVNIGDEDEGLADDLPASAVFVHLPDQKVTPHYMPGLIHVEGILELGAVDERDGRVSAVRLRLDPRQAKQLVAAKPLLRTATR